MKNSSDLKSRINSLTESACTLMSDSERDSFFSYQEDRDSRGVSYPRRYPRRNTYYKGEKKGQLKSVWEVDGKKFNQIWELVKPYVLKSVANSYHRPFIVESDYEEVSEIRYELFNALRFFGPTPCNQPFSSFLSIACLNVLTDSATRRLHQDIDKINFLSISLSSPVSSDSHDSSETCVSDLLRDSINYEVLYGIDLDLPESRREAIVELTSGTPLSIVLRKYKVDKQTLEQDVLSVLR